MIFVDQEQCHQTRLLEHLERFGPLHLANPDTGVEHVYVEAACVGEQPRKQVTVCLAVPEAILGEAHQHAVGNHAAVIVTGELITAAADAVFGDVAGEHAVQQFLGVRAADFERQLAGVAQDNAAANPLQQKEPDLLTIGALTYFFSRWLSSRLMAFIEANPSIAVHVEPITGIADLAKSDIDVAICWGSGKWCNFEHHLLFKCPARPTANSLVAAKVREIGLNRALREIPLLADSSGSTGWQEWHHQAGLDYRPMQNRLVIPDSNDRVQAVIDGQGIALWDALVQNELDSGELCYLSEVALDDVGYYLVYTAPATDRNAVVETFIDWISHQH